MFNSTKQAVINPLYVAGQSFGEEQMVRHSLWKILSETGLIHANHLTEMESIVLSELLKTKYRPGNNSQPVNPQYGMDVLNRAIDKIVCLIKTWQIQDQKYQSVIAENHRLKSGLRGLMKISETAGNSPLPLKLDRVISEIGLSQRTVRLLRSVGINTLQQLRSCTLSRLRNQPGVGVKMIHEIETILLKYSAQAAYDQ